MSRYKKEKINKVLIVIILMFIVFLIDLPLISMVGTSLKRTDEVLTTTGLFPEVGHWSLSNIQGVFQKTNFGMKILNSLMISLTAMVACTIVSAMAGYSLSRFRTNFQKSFGALLFLMQMFPGMLLLIPMFVLYSRLHMVNKPFAVAIYYIAANLAFNIMMIRSFFDTIPLELEEAALVDGCTSFGVFVRVVLPISKPGLATVAIMTFLNCWNEFTFASLLLRKSEVQTLTVGLTNFVQQSSSNWGYLMAASAIAVIPALFFMVFAQKYLVQGMTAGAVKG